jgi:isopentenyl-diphosphate Delta-isomerase
MADIGDRKNDHIELAIHADVGFKRTTLLEEVDLVHCSLPELSWDELDLTVQRFGRTLRAPVVISAMTGGSERAKDINLRLAEVAERGGYALGLGSQRAMVRTGKIDSLVAESYALRQVAQNALIFANIGVIQAGEMSSELVSQMVAHVGADALCVHLNPAQELIQADGDRNFRGALDTIGRLVRELRVPVIVKETGNGISREVALAVRGVGVEHVDVSGAGGTTWVGVETHRASGNERKSGEVFWDWGIPTAASLLEVAPAGFRTIIATGGLKSGLDAARAIALGAHLSGFARPVLQALDQGGVEGALGFLQQIERDLRVALMLTGSKNVAALQKARKMLGSRLSVWSHVSK